MGPLINPLKPKYQLIGVSDLGTLELFKDLKVCPNYALIHSLDGFDEISLGSNFKVIYKDSEKIFSPQDIGMEVLDIKNLAQISSKEEAKNAFIRILTGQGSSAEIDIVSSNAGFALNLIYPQKNIKACILQAKEALLSGKAKKTFEKFLEVSNA